MGKERKNGKSGGGGMDVFYIYIFWVAVGRVGTGVVGSASAVRCGGEGLRERWGNGRITSILGLSFWERGTKEEGSHTHCVVYQ